MTGRLICKLHSYMFCPQKWLVQLVTAPLLTSYSISVHVVEEIDKEKDTNCDIAGA